MKKGFTLVELIAVIGLLTIIILVGAPLLINQIESSKEKNYDNFIADLCLASESYINHSSTLEGVNNFKEPGDTITINMSDLLQGNYVKSSTKNPKTDEPVSSSDTITVTLTEDMTYSCILNSINN